MIKSILNREKRHNMRREIRDYNRVISKNIEKLENIKENLNNILKFLQKGE